MNVRPSKAVSVLVTLRVICIFSLNVVAFESNRPNCNQELPAQRTEVFNCPICQEYINILEPFQVSMVLSCSHIFCTPCIDDWISSNPSCPMCRTNLSPGSVFYGNLLDGIEVFCPYKSASNGTHDACHWEGPFFSLQNHIERECLLAHLDHPGSCFLLRSGEKALIMASEYGEPAEVKMLLSRFNFDVHGLLVGDRFWGQTALMKACRNGQKEVVELLLEHNHSDEHLHAKDKDGDTALMLAIEYGHEQVAKLLFKYYSTRRLLAMVNTRGETIMMKACWNGQHEVVELLLERKPSVELYLLAMNNNGETAITLAFGNGHEQVVELLLEYYHSSLQ